jgi:hypothetical protein
MVLLPHPQIGRAPVGGATCIPQARHRRRLFDLGEAKQTPTATESPGLLSGLNVLISALAAYRLADGMSAGKKASN